MPNKNGDSNIRLYKMVNISQQKIKTFIYISSLIPNIIYKVLYIIFQKNKNADI